MSSLFQTDDQYDPTDPWGVKKRIRDLRGPEAAPEERPRLADAENVFTPRDYASSDPSPAVVSPKTSAGHEDPMAGIYKRRYVPVPAPGPFEHPTGTISRILGASSRAKRQAAMEENAMEERRYQDSLDEARLRISQQGHDASQARSVKPYDKIMSDGTIHLVWRNPSTGEEQDLGEKPQQHPQLRKTVDAQGNEVWAAWNPASGKLEPINMPVGNKPSAQEEGYRLWLQDPKNKGKSWAQYRRWEASLSPEAQAANRPEKQSRKQVVYQYENGQPTTPVIVDTETGEAVPVKGAGPARPPIQPKVDTKRQQIIKDAAEGGLSEEDLVQQLETYDRQNSPALAKGRALANQPPGQPHAPLAKPAAPSTKKYVRTGTRKDGKRVGQLADGTIEVIK